MKTIIIGTTAINRPELHNDIFYEWLGWVLKLDKSQYTIKWFINIDIIEALSHNYEETKLNFEKIADNRLDITFLKSDEKGNFLKACQRVATNIEQYVISNSLDEKDVIIFWLEDDWKLNTKVALPITEIIDNYHSKLSHINLSFIRNNYIHALAPSLISYKLWSTLQLQAWKNQKEHIDPEHCVGLYFNNNFTTLEDDIYNLTVITKYKKIDTSFFESNYINYSNSYYTYHNNNRNDAIIKNKYIDKTDNKIKFNNKMIFIRITCGFCINGCNYGRTFMDKLKLSKSKIQNNTQIDFYKKK